MDRLKFIRTFNTLQIVDWDWATLCPQLYMIHSYCVIFKKLFHLISKIYIQKV